MSGLRFKLCVMMFLQFFIWGAWFELGFSYIPSLGFDATIPMPEFLGGGDYPWQNAMIFGAFNFGALVALFFSTQFADRMFAAEKFLAFSHLIGGVSIAGLYFLHPASGEKASFWPFFVLMLVHSLFYVPTISITNSIAFANLRDPANEFGPVRVWGTIGWIAASWPFIFILVDWGKVGQMQTSGVFDWIGKALGTPLEGAALRSGESHIFLVAGIASVLLAAFSLSLPHTPPKPATSGADSLAWLKAAKLLKHPFIFVLFVVTFIDAAVHQSFFYWTASFLKPVSEGGAVGIPSNWVTAVMKIGQVAEILTMLLLGYVLKNLGWRLTMVIGVLGHAARFAVFAYYQDQTAAVVVNALHGICYAFFFATVYIFVDEYFPKDVRASAQGLFNMLILGIGPFVANLACGVLAKKHAVTAPVVNQETQVTTMVETVNYSVVFQYSMWAAIIGAILLFVLFHPRKPAENGQVG